MFCAICTDDLDPKDARDFEGAKICPDCDQTEEPARTPEVRQRGYTGGDGGIGVRFREQVSSAHDDIVPASAVKLDILPVVTATSDKVACRDDALTANQRAYHFGRDSVHRRKNRT